jgi:Spy/CpxP family protein refolding chaperone
MNVPRILFFSLVAFLTVATRGAAQPAKWWQDDKFKAELGLTADQVNKIEEVFKASVPKLRASYEELDRREAQLSSLIEKAETSEADVVRQADQVEAVRSDLSKERTLMLFRIRLILSPDQRVKLKELHTSRERGRPRGPGRDNS